MSADELLQQLEEQRAAFLALEQRVHDALKQEKQDAEGNDACPGTPNLAAIGRQSTVSIAEPLRKATSGIASLMQTGSALSVDSDDEDDESYYVQTPLPKRTLAEDKLREYLRTYDWSPAGQKILENIIHNGRLKHPVLFHKPSRANDKAHYAHYEVFDVSTDGSPLSITGDDEESISKSAGFWNAFREVNQDEEKSTTVGRIIVAQEPSPIIFGALHFAMNEHFDMDEIYRHLVESEITSAFPHRAFDEDPRRQRTFTFCFEYFTIIGDERKPMPWQSSDKQVGESQSHIPLTRCSSVVALALLGDPIKKVRNTSRRTNAKTKHGQVYDPFSPWIVLNVQACPDWESSADVHDSSKHYVNGPEAFLQTVLMEFRDARRRYEEIYRRITKLITPPPDFIFDEELRDRRLFEDSNFTFTRGYFWAHQTLGSINDSIKAMIDAYEDTFTEEVWEGKHKTLWPLMDEEMPRNDHFRRKAYLLRKELEREMRKLRTQIEENNARRGEIRDLRDQLFSGTSVLESRKSVELAEITILQGHNVKLLTLVNIFFLPLTFVTSVFGMTNMPTEPHFWPFGITMVCVCVPFLLLIGSLNTTKGYEFWKTRCKALFKTIGWFIRFMSGFLGRRKDRKKAAKEAEAAAAAAAEKHTETTEDPEDTAYREFPFERTNTVLSNFDELGDVSTPGIEMEKESSSGQGDGESQNGARPKKGWWHTGPLRGIHRRMQGHNRLDSQTRVTQVV
ncbi:uncharacterized protein K452DRAFT_237687 [Aplosporella prunicola CBS 121167]|uniref:Uncharacterized protein n=1 Tax=Aplosporella prunicola CBS 121167 TaxID=1176127 RepID=A0A6A6AYT6_9PEZI|nr:uncharacterized protein K452DRAFT_237802 [Aplosporella prunicola CBS 121167]XP_033392071.1 uncharacterized protein K452DRAFT_237687 [Aplosporella prunicola CBS 121167]KAF2136265.1 hypothetical protein K452DRAFT_237802 [Aplosporella prunicola CBS 121167]KAF2136353.1 hypothetical protein K452DRAFT_237687 [Aplosporella prunicola CBS 121167]